MKKKAILLKIGILLIIISIPFFLFLFALPFLEIEHKGKLSLILLITGEILFWLGGILVGKELFTKYKSYLNPVKWFKKRKKENPE